jgi:hypothetical protein
MITFDTQTAAADDRTRLLATLNLCLLALDIPRLYSDQARTAIHELRKQHDIRSNNHVTGRESSVTALPIGGLPNV